MDWWDVFSAFRNETVPRRVPTLKAGMAMVPKYASDAQILEQKYGVDGKPDALDPIVAGLTEDDLAALLPEW